MTFTTSQEFDTIAAEVRASTNPVDDTTQLKLYGLYKQAIFGDNPSKAPMVALGKDSAKLKAWAQRKGTSQEDAQESYIVEAKKVLKK